MLKGLEMNNFHRLIPDDGFVSKKPMLATRQNQYCNGKSVNVHFNAFMSEPQFLSTALSLSRPAAAFPKSGLKPLISNRWASS